MCENACEQVMFGFGFAFDWSRNGARFLLLANHKAQQCKTKAFFANFFHSQYYLLKTDFTENCKKIMNIFNYINYFLCIL